LQDENATIESAQTLSKQTLLLALLEEQLKALHPFMPFITETIWTEVMGQEQLLMVSAWPIGRNKY
jgi:valyl-tRNA synthetase